VHTRTHIDAPLHLLPGGKAVDELPLEPFIGSAQVVASRAGGDYAGGPGAREPASFNGTIVVQNEKLRSSGKAGSS